MSSKRDISSSYIDCICVLHTFLIAVELPPWFSSVAINFVSDVNIVSLFLSLFCLLIFSSLNYCSISCVMLCLHKINEDLQSNISQILYIKNILVWIKLFTNSLNFWDIWLPYQIYDCITTEDHF